MVPILYKSRWQRVKAALARAVGHLVHFTSDRIWTDHRVQYAYLSLIGYWWDLQQLGKVLKNSSKSIGVPGYRWVILHAHVLWAHNGQQAGFQDLRQWSFPGLLSEIL